MVLGYFPPPSYSSWRQSPCMLWVQPLYSFKVTIPVLGWAEAGEEEPNHGPDRRPDEADRWEQWWQADLPGDAQTCQQQW